jgi:hypothetical protein
MWPLIIDVDKERDLKFYYPFTPSYWCPAKVEAQDEPLRDEEDRLINDSIRRSDDHSSREMLQIQE